MRATDLMEWAEERGYRVAWGPWSIVQESLDDLAQRRRAGDLAEDLDRDYLISLDDSAAAPASSSRWVILVLVPRPAHRVTFTAAGKAFRTLVPPTYVGFRPVRARVLEDLRSSVFEGGEPLQPLASLHKATAARLGLVTYGRNNVTYAEGLGSYFQIVGCWTTEDLSEGASPPRPPVRLSACDTCTACIPACPTGAIPEDRFLLRADRCLVFHNERADAFPSWIPPRAHNALIGCMLCQTCCPADAGKLRVEDTGLVFSEEETRAVLDSASNPEDAHLRTAAAKLATLELTEEAAPIWRNLRALFVAKGWPLPSGG